MKKTFVLLSLASLLAITGCGKAEEKKEDTTPEGDTPATPGTIDDLDPKDGDHYGGVEQSGTVGLSYTLTQYLNNDKWENGYKVTGYEGSNPNVVIPSTFNKLPVVEIDDRAFQNNLVIESLTLGKNIRNIGDYAFSRTFNMTKVNIERGNPYLVIEDGLVYHVEKEGKTEVSRTLYFGEAGRYVSFDTYAKKITKLAFGCFGNFENLIYLRMSLDLVPTYPNSIQGKENHLYYLFNYSSSTSQYRIDKMKSAFVPHLSTLVLGGDTVSAVPSYFCQYLYSLTSVVLEEGITAVNIYSFAHCTRLRNVEFPSTMEYINGTSFAYTDDLYRLYFKKTTNKLYFYTYSSSYGVFYNKDRNWAMYLVFEDKTSNISFDANSLKFDPDKGSTASTLSEKTYQDYLDINPTRAFSEIPPDPAS